MTRVDEKAVERSVKDRLKQLAKSQGKVFNEVWQVLVLERFLVRLSRSDYRDHFVFKGGLLLAQYMKLGRETADLDFLALKLKSEATQVQAAMKTIAATRSEDGFRFDEIATEELSHEHMHYPGFRVSMTAHLGGTKTPIQIDLGFGDVVEPQKMPIPLMATAKGPIFETEISLMVYPPETIFAEKLETVFYRGATNSRMKDFHDLWLIHRENGLLDPLKLTAAIQATFAHRETAMAFPIRFKPEEIAQLQGHWTAHLRETGEAAAVLALPGEIQGVLKGVNQYLAKNCPELLSDAKT